jgi:hypothetical protein
MLADEIRGVKQIHLTSDSAGYWVAEVAAQLAELNAKMGTLCMFLEQLTKQNNHNTSGKTVVRKPAAVIKANKDLTRTRRYYVVEWVPSLPVKIDKIYDKKPKGKYHHEIMAHDLTDAKLKIVARLTKERTEDQNRLAAEPESKD